MRLISIACALLLPVVLHAQNPRLYVLEQERDRFVKTPVLNDAGAIAFSLPEGHTPKVAKDRFNQVWSSGDITLNPFRSGPCVVASGGVLFESYYLIDAKGKMVKNLGNRYGEITPFSEGYAVIEPTTKVYQFLDSTGNVAFGNKKFKHAESFKNGYAAVRLTTGEWAYLDRKGNVAIRVTVPTNGGEIYKAGPFSEGYMQIHVGFGYKQPGKYYFIDRTGKITIDLQTLFAGKEIGTMGNVSEGTFLVGIKGTADTESTMALVSTAGKVIRTFPDANIWGSYLPVAHGMGAVTVGTAEKRRPVLFDASGKTIHPVYDSTVHTLYNVQVITPEYYIVEGVKGRDSYEYIFSRATNQLVYESRHHIAGIDGDVAYIKHSYQQTCELVRISTGGRMFATDDRYREYGSLWIIKSKENTRLVHLYDYKTLPAELFQLDSLEYLQLDRGDLAAIPADIGKLKNLRRLDLYSLRKLTALPAELAQLPRLEELRIQSCTGITNVQAVIGKLPALRRLYLENVKLSEAFVKKLKQTRPKLSIYTISTPGEIMDIQEQEATIIFDKN